jgi:hypothetical protein
MSHEEAFDIGELLSLKDKRRKYPVRERDKRGNELRWQKCCPVRLNIMCQRCIGGAYDMEELGRSSFHR